MATNYAISATQLREGSIVLIKGKMIFSRLASLVSGEALARSDQQRVANGMTAVGRPHTTLSLAEAEVVYQDPANPTVEEQFVAERRYSSKKHPEHGLSYSIDNKSDRLPIVAKLNDAGQAEQVTLEGELAAGLPVIVVLRVFKPRNYNNRGLSLDQVIVQDTKLTYYSQGATNEALAAAGIVFAAPPVAVTAPAVENASATDSDPQIAAAQAAGAWPTPSTEAPAAAPVASTDPYRSTEAPAPAAAAAPAAPAQSDAQAQIEALQSQLAAAHAAAAAQQAGGSPFAPAQGPIVYTGE